MTLRESIENDAGTVFLRSDDFAETVTYYPHVGFGQAESSRVIKAVVIREQVTASSADGGDVVVPIFEVYVANDSSTGISSSEVNTGGDWIEISTRIGGSTKKRSIIYLTNHDDGMLVLQCQ
jgi:hypothetical protein